MEGQRRKVAVEEWDGVRDPGGDGRKVVRLWRRGRRKKSKDGEEPLL